MNLRPSGMWREARGSVEEDKRENFALGVRPGHFSPPCFPSDLTPEFPQTLSFYFQLPK